MAEFKFSCGHCGGKLTAQEEWEGQIFNCPVCGNRIIVPPLNHGSVIRCQETPVPSCSGSKRRRYFFGRAYIPVARIAAMLVALAAGYLIFREASLLRSELISLRSSSAPETIRSAFELQKAAVDEFSYTVNLLSAPEQSGPNIFTGLPLPPETLQVRRRFNDRLKSDGDIAESLAAAKEFQEKTEAIQTQLRSYLDENLTMLRAAAERQAPQESVIEPTTAEAETPGSSSAPIRISRTSTHPFYVSAPGDRELSNLFERLLSSPEVRRSPEMLRQLNNYRSFQNFYRRKMLARQGGEAEEGGIRTNLPVSEPQQVRTARTEGGVLWREYQNLADFTRQFAPLASRDENPTWQVSVTLRQLTAQLEALSEERKQAGKARSAAIEHRVIRIGFLLGALIFLAGFLLAFADLLRVNFDLYDEKGNMTQ